MKAIIILGLSSIAYISCAQEQRYQQQNISANSRVNFSFVNNISFNNIQINTNDHVQKQQVRNLTRLAPARKYAQTKVNNTVKNPTAQVRRLTRPRTVVATPRAITQPQIDPLNNVLEANEMINASNINVPEQNFVLPVNIDVQSQGFSNVAKEGSNPFVPQETNKVDLDANIDLSLSLKGKTVIRSTSSSSHSKSHAFSKKIAKFKRVFFGKLTSHKKGNHRLDLCFKWKN